MGEDKWCLTNLGFSKQLVALLNTHEVEFKTFDILQDEAVRQSTY